MPYMDPMGKEMLATWILSKQIEQCFNQKTQGKYDMSI